MRAVATVLHKHFFKRTFHVWTSLPGALSQNCIALSPSADTLHYTSPPLSNLLISGGFPSKTTPRRCDARTYRFP